MSQSIEYERGWRDGYGEGRDDEAHNEPVRTSPVERQQQQSPRDRQAQPPRNR